MIFVFTSGGDWPILKAPCIIDPDLDLYIFGIIIYYFQTGPKVIDKRHLVPQFLKQIILIFARKYHKLICRYFSGPTVAVYAYHTFFSSFCC